MNDELITRYSYETGQEETYKKIIVEEEVYVKKEKFTLNNSYYQRLSDGELFEPFDDPDYNIKNAYKLYRNKFNLLSSDEVINIRKMYQLSIREFANILGISYSNLSLIENGGIQAKYIDNILRLSRNVYAFKRLVEERKLEFSDEEYNKIMSRVSYLSKEHDKHLNYTLIVRNKSIVLNTSDENLVLTKKIEAKENIKWKNNLTIKQQVGTLNI